MEVLQRDISLMKSDREILQSTMSENGVKLCNG